MFFSRNVVVPSMCSSVYGSWHDSRDRPVSHASFTPPLPSRITCTHGERRRTNEQRSGNRNTCNNFIFGQFVLTFDICFSSSFAFSFRCSFRGESEFFRCTFFCCAQCFGRVDFYTPDSRVETIGIQSGFSNYVRIFRNFDRWILNSNTFVPR